MSKTSIVRVVCLTLIFIGLLNFTIFLVMTWHLGGDAVNGRTSGGHYYVWGYQPKTKQKLAKAFLTLVSGMLYSNFATWTVMIAAGIAMNRAKNSN
jgi:hypothetical protein